MMEDEEVVPVPTVHMCPNCQTTFTGYFCSHCGQKLIIRRTTLHTLYQDFLQIVLNVESILSTTIKQLSFHPGLFFHDYLQGRRKRYSQPLQYFLLTLTTYVLLSQVIIYFVNLINPRSLPSRGDARGQGAQFMQILRDGSYYLEFIYPPILALFFYLFFRKERINYAESLIFCIYLVANVLLICTLLLPLAFMSPLLIGLSKEVVGLLFFVYASVHFSQQSWLHSFGKAMVAYIAARIAVHSMYYLIVNGILRLNL
jgi:hypothetical protein